MELYHQAKRIMSNPCSILFVTSQLRQREIKMAYALKSLGWFVGLIYTDVTPHKADQYFDFSFIVNSAKEAYRVAKTISPALIHVFSGAIDSYIHIFCKHKIAPVIIDLNDMFIPSLMQYCHERFLSTRKALARADAFCARDLQVKCAERIDEFKIPNQMILYPEYCWGLSNKNIPKKSNDEVHVVAVGTFSLESLGMYDCCYLELTQLFLHQGIHVHIYPPWQYRTDNYSNPHCNFENDYAQFIKLEKGNPYLHIHRSVPVEKLIDELQQYDFGLISGGYQGFGQTYTHFRPAYVASCYSGRIADYLDAGLPVLINDEVSYGYRLLKHYGVCIDLKGVLKPGFKKELQALKQQPELSARVVSANRMLSIKNNGVRLAKFYTNLKQASNQVGWIRRFLP